MSKRKGRVVKKTIHEWLQERDFAIVDPDGFDRKDPDLKTKKFTEKEFDKRASFCTCVWEGNRRYALLKNAFKPTENEGRKKSGGV